MAHHALVQAGGRRRGRIGRRAHQHDDALEGPLDALARRTVGEVALEIGPLARRGVTVDDLRQTPTQRDTRIVHNRSVAKALARPS